ncbi:MAG: OmpA family protein [Myxococcales bacterium]|nr:OmpA family protein [Myxococcales bacterium]MCB9733079.1 OmpA family protein [Deltaproteobacteria bacterium]
MKSAEIAPRSLHGVLLTLVAGVLAALALSGCPKSYPDCDDDKGCKSHGEVCIDGKCRQCRDDSQCTKLDACMTCVANECVKRAGCCKSDLDCPNGKCFKNPGNPSGPGTCQECGNDSHCPSGQKCSNGSCVPDIACTDDSFCPDGQKCINGKCIVSSCEPTQVYFDFNEYVIRLDQESVVQANASCISKTTARWRAEGHCDERGSDEYNLALGQRRAASVVRQYQALGVARENLSVISYGEEKPVCGESNESCWSKNRRVETVRQ